ncbi:MAG: acetyl-CoA carboxylase biotin carboxyl carrier protein [Bacteroidetes bacterium]|nr:acetyl-CoA carboxylase biotin carboxyl carrier protein [Bacteroidota bacterium]
MDLQFIRKCIKIVNDAQIAELEIEEEGKRLRITRAFAVESQPASFAYPSIQHVQTTEPPPQATTAEQPEEKPAQTAVEDKYMEVRSPIVGTFYRSSTPDAEPYVKVGETVASGQVLCIIEAMKIMNEIESDVSGRVVNVLVENGQPVEYNQPLFLVDPS